LDWRVLPELNALCRSRDIDIIHAHEYKTDLLAFLAARNTNVIALATAHGWTGHTWRERNVYYPADKRLLARFPHVVAVSSEIRDQLLRAGAAPDRVSVVLNGIDPDAFRRTPEKRYTLREKFGVRPEDTVIGSVGRLEPQKRFDLLIDSIAILRARWPRLKLMIAGDGSLQQELQRQIDSAGLDESCVLLGLRRDIVDLHHVFDLYVQSSDYEGTPNAVLEAMALETPLVATDVGGTAELLRTEVDGIVVPVGSPQVLAAAIERLLNDPARARTFAASARQRIETDLSFASRMRQVEQIYRQLMVSRHLPEHARA
jgi:glycosyltransferase involved in cell wall biosynthesis